jgi:hypothetical protein
MQHMVDGVWEIWLRYAVLNTIKIMRTIRSGRGLWLEWGIEALGIKGPGSQ